MPPQGHHKCCAGAVDVWARTTCRGGPGRHCEFCSGHPRGSRLPLTFGPGRLHPHSMDRLDFLFAYHCCRPGHPRVVLSRWVLAQAASPRRSRRGQGRTKSLVVWVGHPPHAAWLALQCPWSERCGTPYQIRLAVPDRQRRARHPRCRDRKTASRPSGAQSLGFPRPIDRHGTRCSCV